MNHRERALSAPRCTAHRTNGEPCRAPAVRGTNVCRKHGGNAPQVREAAARRIALMVDPSLAVYDKALRLPPNADSARLGVAVKVAGEVIERTLGPVNTPPAHHTEVSIGSIQIAAALPGDALARIMELVQSSMPTLEPTGSDQPL